MYVQVLIGLFSTVFAVNAGDNCSLLHGGQCYPNTEYCGEIVSDDSHQLCSNKNQICCQIGHRMARNMCKKIHGGECIGKSRLPECAMIGMGWDGSSICPKRQECCTDFHKVKPTPTANPTVKPTPTTNPPVKPTPTTDPPVKPTPTTDPPVKPTSTTNPPVDGECGRPEVPVHDGDWRIVGGETSKHGNWPWQVSLRKNGNHFCGGSILNRNWILTAAHCFGRSSRPRQFTVVTGDHKQDRSEGTEQQHTVSQIIRHSGYTGSSASSPHDIALIRLAKPITYDKYRKRVCLNKERGRFDYKNQCWLTGWGQTQGTGNPLHLQQVKGHPISYEHCQRLWGRNSIAPGHICFGEGGTGACMGDSGGPWVCKDSETFFLVGVTSWGTSDCKTPGYPSVYTRVSSYIDWIEERIH